MPPPDSTPRLTFPRRMRLSGGGQFSRVYEAKARASAGPLLIYARPNGLDFSRLGLSVSRRVGKAVARNRIKRLLREAFRLDQYERDGMPDDGMLRDAERAPSRGGGYDLVISVRPHEPLELAAYRALLRQAAQKLHQSWTKRRARSKAPGPQP